MKDKTRPEKAHLDSTAYCQGGFSLIELAIVIVIISIVAIIGVPNFQRWQHTKRLAGAARAIYSDMQLARLGSVRTGVNWAIFFDTANNRYFVYSGPGADNAMGSNVNVAALADNPGVDGQVPARAVYLAGKDLDTNGNGAVNIPPAAPEAGDLLDVSNIKYGRGSRPLVAGGVNGNNIPIDFVSFAGNIVTFSPAGTSNNGYIYMDHCPDPANPANNANQDACNAATAPAYSVGSLTSGLPVVRRWLNGRWEQ